MKTPGMPSGILMGDSRGCKNFPLFKRRRQLVQRLSLNRLRKSRSINSRRITRSSLCPHTPDVAHQRTAKQHALNRKITLFRSVYIVSIKVPSDSPPSLLRHFAQQVSTLLRGFSYCRAANTELIQRQSGVLCQIP